jgi:pilus assembly protein Flp/PilA
MAAGDCRLRDQQTHRGALRVRSRGSYGMNSLKRLFSDILRDESGQDLIEYALVAALVGLGATASMKTLATTIGTALTGIGTRLTSAI